MTAISDDVTLADITPPGAAVEPPDLPRGLPEGFLPLTDEENRDLYRKVSDLHEWIGELREMKDRFPEMLASMPAPLRMMFSGMFT